MTYTHLIQAALDKLPEDHATLLTGILNEDEGVYVMDSIMHRIGYATDTTVLFALNALAEGIVIEEETSDQWVVRFDADTALGAKVITNSPSRSIH